MMLGHCELSGRSGHEAGRELLAALYREATGEDLPPSPLLKRGNPTLREAPGTFPSLTRSTTPSVPCPGGLWAWMRRNWTGLST